MNTVPKNALVLFIGPSGAGKSTICRDNFKEHEIFESDKIRIELFGTKEKGDIPNHLFFGKVFCLLNERVDVRLSLGCRAVLDMTNLKAADRRTYLDMADKYNIPVFYIVFDRPLDEKIKTQGWREGQFIGNDSLVVAMDKQFKSNEAMILSGDNGRAEVIDARIEGFIVE